VVAVERTTVEGVTSVLFFRKKGAIIGADAYFARQRRGAVDVRSVGAATTGAISITALASLCNPPGPLSRIKQVLQDTLVGDLLASVEDTFDRVVELSACTAHQRVESAIRRLAKEFGEPHALGTLLRLDSSMLQAYAGASHETVRRVKQSLIDSGAIVMGRANEIILVARKR
jgi:CRP-like cAMP-binding protein